MVTSERHIQELANAPLQQLSLHAVAKEVSSNACFLCRSQRLRILQPKYTMYGFEWNDQRGIEGIGFVRALRSLLTAHLTSLRPSVSSNIAESLESEMMLGSRADRRSDVPTIYQLMF